MWRWRTALLLVTMLVACGNDSTSSSTTPEVDAPQTASAVDAGTSPADAGTVGDKPDAPETQCPYPPCY